MPKSAFPYPGGKYYTADRIVNSIPEHRRYVEPFGGAATILFNKKPSPIEVYNDTNGDVVHFFDVLRNKPDELCDWLAAVPYSRDLWDEWATEYFAGEHPDDDIERAGRFFYLRYAQVGGKIDGKQGFRAPTTRNAAEQLHKRVQDLPDFAARFQHVVIENRDYTEIMSRYDGENTLFYCDPPYVATESYYGGEFDHQKFLNMLFQSEANWLLTYDELLDGFDWEQFHVRTESGTYRMGSQANETTKSTTEYLVSNFNPDQTPSFSEANQSTLTAHAER